MLRQIILRTMVKLLYTLSIQMALCVHGIVQLLIIIL